MNKRQLIALVTISGMLLSPCAYSLETLAKADTVLEDTSSELDNLEEKDTSLEDEKAEDTSASDTSGSDTSDADTDDSNSSDQDTETTPSQPSTPSQGEETKEDTATSGSTSSTSTPAVVPIQQPSSLPSYQAPSYYPPISSSTLDEDYSNDIKPVYVKDWSGEDAYSHHLLCQRYGITAEQLDGFLDATGIAYDKSRINGEKLLEWQEKSGLDVRAIVAIAIMESSLGTQGVASNNGANLFGYGAFDNNPDNAKNYDDDKAVCQLTAVTIIKHQNTSFKRQDIKAQKLAEGTLDVSSEGGVYFTDTSGSGKRRAEIMEALNDWIDENGGTPEAPSELIETSGSATLQSVPAGYELSKKINVSNYISQTYPWGQCTWYSYNRARELGVFYDAYMGNGGSWKDKAGYPTTNTPKVGYAVSFSPNQAGADSTYGHVAIVEVVNEDGSILISESNVLGLGIVSYRTFSAQDAKKLTYVIGKIAP